MAHPRASSCDASQVTNMNTFVGKPRPRPGRGLAHRVQHRRGPRVLPHHLRPPAPGGRPPPGVVLSALLTAPELARAGGLSDDELLRWAREYRATYSEDTADDGGAAISLVKGGGRDRRNRKRRSEADVDNLPRYRGGISCNLGQYNLGSRAGNSKERCGSSFKKPVWLQLLSAFVDRMCLVAYPTLVVQEEDRLDGTDFDKVRSCRP